MKVISGIIAAIGAVSLTFLLFVAGYYACSLPITTEVLSQNTSKYEISPYTLDDLNTLAVACRDYTVDARAAGTTEEDARATFNSKLMEAATHSATRYLSNGTSASDADKQKEEAWENLLTALKQKDPDNAFGAEDVNATATAMAAKSDAYALDEDAFQHLDDCNKLINSIEPCSKYFLVVAIVCLLLLLVLRRWRALGRMLSIAPIALLVMFAFAGAWAVVDFNSFFAAFHGVFFPQGNWTFSSESLLICMYPTAFWMAMGGLWLATTVVASIIFLFLSRPFYRLADRKENDETGESNV